LETRTGRSFSVSLSFNCRARPFQSFVETVIDGKEIRAGEPAQEFIHRRFIT